MADDMRTTYAEQGFSESQIDQIMAGINEGLNPTVYARIDLDSALMMQIRLGMEHSLDMNPYADSRYDWFQVAEIREGMLLGLEVSRYDSPEIPSEKMHELRRGLEDGMDLSDFVKYPADIIKELRNALVKHIDIVSYVEQGYNAGQLKEIAYAIGNDIDIYQHINVEYRAAAIHEIVLGIEHNVDVELYAKPCYSWSKMEQLRLGLEAQVDISYYESPLYDRYQMEQIRLGLEAGIEVSEYNSFMYPASFMKKMRLELENGAGYVKTDETISEGEENKDGLTISVSNDDMIAYIRLNSNNFGITTRKDILRSLRLVGITQNIDPRMVDDLLSGKHLNEVVQIATGRPPIDGADGFYEYFFDTDKKRTPKILPDGSADFQNMNWYEMVKKDQKLAYYHSAGKGEEGHTVTGKRIPAKRGKELTSLRGKGFVVMPDKKTYIAESDGRVDLDGNKLNVLKMMYLPEVNQATGSVEFAGDIIISGDVTDGVSIKAGGDVIVDGFVGNCRIEADGDVIMKKGVNAAGTGLIVAKGSVEAKFFESANIKAGRNITANYCLNSNVYSEDSISIFGSKGLILGGKVFAANDIKVANLGNESGTRSIIKLGISDVMKEEQKKVDNKLVDLNNKLLILKKGQKDFQDKYSAEIRNSMEMYIKIENALFTLHQEEEELVERREKIMRQIMATADAMITVTNNLFENIIIQIDDRKILSTRTNNVTVKKIENRVGIFKNN